MDRKRLRDILCACVIMLMLPCSAYIIRGMSMPYERIAQPGVPQDTVTNGNDSSAVAPQLPDSLDVADSTFALPDSTVTLPDSLTSGIDSVAADSTAAAADTAAGADSTEYEPWELREMARDSARRVRDSLKAIRDSIRWSKPRVLETGFVPDSLYYKRILSWNTGPYVNEYRQMRMDTTFNDWFTEYPFYKVRVIAFHQYRRLPVVQSFKFCGLVYDGPDHFPVVLVGGGECHRLPDLVVVYEFFRFCGISNILLSVHSGLVNLYQIYTFLISSQIYSDDMCRPACRSSSPRGVVASVDGNLIADASERCFQVRQPLG